MRFNEVKQFIITFALALFLRPITSYSYSARSLTPALEDENIILPRMDSDETQVITSSTGDMDTDIQNCFGIRLGHSKFQTFDFTHVQTPGSIKSRKEHIEAKGHGFYQRLLDLPTRRKLIEVTKLKIQNMLPVRFATHENKQTNLDKSRTDIASKRSINHNTRTVSPVEIERLLERLRHVQHEDLFEELATALALRERLQYVATLLNPPITSDNLVAINEVIESVIRRRLETWTGKRSRFQAWGGKRKRAVPFGTGNQYVSTLLDTPITPDNLAVIKDAIESALRRRSGTLVGQRSRFQAWGGRRKRSLPYGTGNYNVSALLKTPITPNDLAVIKYFRDSVLRQRFGTLEGQGTRFQSWGGKRKHEVPYGNGNQYATNDGDVIGQRSGLKLAERSS